MDNPKHIEFYSDNTLLRGRFYYPINFIPEDKNPIVIMATGDGSIGSKSKSWPPLINAIIEIGFPVFIFDFYGLGESDGEVSNLNTTLAIKNLESAITLVLERKWVDKDRIGILASSFGGAVSLLVQSKNNVFKVMGLKSPVSFIPESYETEVGPSLHKWRDKGCVGEIKFHYETYLDSIKYNIYQSALSISVPILIVHGEADTIVPIQQSIRLNCLLKNSMLEMLAGVNHGYKEPNAIANLIILQQKFFKSKL